MLAAPPLSLYIHMPWCVRKCPYCDFNSHHKPDEFPEKAYIERLCEQAKQVSHLAKGREIVSIFIGGGTPNLMSPDSYQQLFDILKQHYVFSDSIEITMEANPGAQEHHDFKAFRATGINRLSLGAQSFSDQQLKVLGRIHSSDEIIKAYHDARAGGFDNINIDIMHGLINQTVEQGLTDLQQAIDLKPNHISWYQLTLEPNTVFAKKPPPTSSIDTIDEMEQQGFALLKQYGYVHYEVSAFAQANQLCQHNLNYWQFGDYIGLGAGAHGKITDVSKQTIYRTTHYKRPETYMQSDKDFATFKAIAASDLAFEFMLNALRLYQAISFELFSQRTGLAKANIENILQDLQQQQFITLKPDTFELTPLGHRYLNDVVSSFL